MAVAYRSGKESLVVVVFEELVAGDAKRCACAGESDAVTYRWYFDTGCQEWCQRLCCWRDRVRVRVDIILSEKKEKEGNNKHD